MIDCITGSTLVIPCVSMGNIPQLTVDLLICTFSLQYVGDLLDMYLYPFVSARDRLESDKPCPGLFATALQVYYSKEHNLTVIQQRSPIISQYRNLHTKEVILPFIQEHKFNSVHVLDSSDAGSLPHGSGKPIVVIEGDALIAESLAELKIHDSIPHPAKLFSVQCQLYINGIYKIVGTQSLKVVLAHVYEGDNFDDAETMAGKICVLLGLHPVTPWIKPISWKGVYGDRPIPRAMEEGLYG